MLDDWARWVRRWAAVCVLILGPTLAIQVALSETPKDAPDPTVSVRSDNEVMQAAKAKAHQTLPEFLRLARNPPEGTSAYLVKIGIPHDDGEEFMWFALESQKGDHLIGRLVNTPQHTRLIRYGQRVSFSPPDIADWSYREGNRRIGNFTACAIAKLSSPAEAEAMIHRHGLTC